MDAHRIAIPLIRSIKLKSRGMIQTRKVGLPPRHVPRDGILRSACCIGIITAAMQSARRTSFLLLGVRIIVVNNILYIVFFSLGTQLCIASLFMHGAHAPCPADGFEQLNSFAMIDTAIPLYGMIIAYLSNTCLLF